MKKIVLFLAIASLTTFGFSSCRKCITCKATDISTGATVDTQEYCGTRAVRNLDQSTYELSWNTSSTTASCN